MTQATQVPELSGNPSTVTLEITRWLHSTLRGHLSCWYDVRGVGSRWVITDGVVVGEGPGPTFWRNALAQGMDAAEFELRPDSPRRGEVNQVVGLPSVRRRTGIPWSQSVARFYDAFGLVDHRRALLYEGRRFLGWLGSVRAEGSAPFGPDASRAFGQALPALRAALRAHSCDPCLESTGLHNCVVKPSGRVVFLTECAARWMVGDRRRRVKEAILRAAHPAQSRTVYIDHVETTITPLSGYGERHYLLTFSPTTEAMLDPRHALSPRQREVASLTAAGASASEVARMISLSVHTTRDHLKAVYKVLGVSSRAELGRVWRDFEA